MIPQRRQSVGPNFPVNRVIGTSSIDRLHENVSDKHVGISHAYNYVIIIVIAISVIIEISISIITGFRTFFRDCNYA